MKKRFEQQHGDMCIGGEVIAESGARKTYAFPTIGANNRLVWPINYINAGLLKVREVRIPTKSGLTRPGHGCICFCCEEYIIFSSEDLRKNERLGTMLLCPKCANKAWEDGDKDLYALQFFGPKPGLFKDIPVPKAVEPVVDAVQELKKEKETVPLVRLDESSIEYLAYVMEVESQKIVKELTASLKEHITSVMGGLYSSDRYCSVPPKIPVGPEDVAAFVKAVSSK